MEKTRKKLAVEKGIIFVVLLAVLVSGLCMFRTNAASYATVKSCKGLTVKKVGNDWVTVNSKGTRVTYTGVASNSLGWWRVENGTVNFKATGIYDNDYGWWRVENGKVDFNANSIYQNQYGWWKTTNGKVTFKENGVFQNSLGWWYVKNSKVDFSYTGYAANMYGTWYVVNGKVDFSHNRSNTSTQLTTTTIRTTTTTTTTTKASVNVNTYVSYAQSYAQSIGLTYSSGCGTWTTPSTISANLSDAEMKQNIRDTLDSLKNNRGAEYYKVWSEPKGNGDYKLYIAWG